jgi:hypothetical protein
MEERALPYLMIGTTILSWYLALSIMPDTWQIIFFRMVLSGRVS